jgi:hypothetical protein
MIQGEHHTQVLDPIPEELTLLWFQEEVIVPKCLQNSLHSTDISSRVLVKLKMSSKYTMQTPLSIHSWRMLLIMFWKVPGEFHSLKNMTKGSKSP